MEKTKFKGVYFDSITNKYCVKTTFTTKDGFKVSTTKRGFDTAKKASDWKNEQTVKYKSSIYNPNALCNNTLNTLLDKYLKYKSNRVKSTTLTTLEANLNKYFVNFFKGKKLENIKPADINALYNNIASSDLSISTKNTQIIFILGFVEWLELMSYIDHETYKKFKIILQKFKEIETVKNDFLEVDEFKKFIDTFGYDEKDKVYRLLFNYLFYGGMRLGEALALTFNDIDYIKRKISITKQVQPIAYVSDIGCHYKIKNGNYILPFTKTNSIKILDMPEFIIESTLELQQKQAFKGDDFIFSINNKLISRNAIRERFKQHLKVAGVKEVRIHDLRHSNVTMLYDLGADPKFVKERMGHATELTSINTYNHLTKNKRDENNLIIKKLEQI